MVSIDLSAKAVVSLVAGFAASGVVRNIIANNTAPQTPFQEGMNWIGSFAIGAAVSETIQDRTRRQLDNLTDVYEEMKAEQAKRQ